MHTNNYPDLGRVVEDDEILNRQQLEIGRIAPQYSSDRLPHVNESMYQ